MSILATSPMDDLLGFIVLLNPFALSLYLTGLMDELEDHEFLKTLTWASVMSAVIFAVFAFSGKTIVIDFFGVGPDALRAFGGIIISIVAYGYVVRGYRSMEQLRGSLDELPSAIAVPYMVGAGSLTKSILLGEQNSPAAAMLILTVGVAATFAVVMVFKYIRHGMRRSHARIFDRYVNMLSRVNGLLLGAVAMDMIVNSVRNIWAA